jgi:hypothetical protein
MESHAVATLPPLPGSTQVTALSCSSQRKFGNLIDTRGLEKCFLRFIEVMTDLLKLNYKNRFHDQIQKSNYDTMFDRFYRIL